MINQLMHKKNILMNLLLLYSCMVLKLWVGEYVSLDEEPIDLDNIVTLNSFESNYRQPQK